jgi:hypothetical protein
MGQQRESTDAASCGNVVEDLLVDGRWGQCLWPGLAVAEVAGVARAQRCGLEAGRASVGESLPP